jgi:hypothetical protein
VCEKTVCNVGYHVQADDSGDNRCRKCPAGKSSKGGDLVADGTTNCDVKLFCDTKGKYVKSDHSCDACPNWEKENAAVQDRATVATAGKECVEITCKDNEYVKVTGDCGTAAGGNQKNNRVNCGTDNQTPCDTKKRCEDSVTEKGFWTKTEAKCVACPAGKKIDAGGSLRSDASTSCVDDHPLDDTKKDPKDDKLVVDHAYLTLCGKDEHVVDHVCKKCEDGYERPAGDDPNSPVNTACSKKHAPKPHEVLCLKDQRVQAHKCVDCPKGTTNAKGDDPHHHDTVCHKTRCLANFHVQAHKCVPCAAGLTNTAGDDASGNPTKCYEH